LREFEEEFSFLYRANFGGEFMRPEDRQRVLDIAKRTWVMDGQNPAIFSNEERSGKIYNIERGTLTKDEREIINNHIVVTIDMLDKLPYPKALRRVPEFAGGHHERMDGKGYPKGLTRDQMSIQARMMGVADIF